MVSLALALALALALTVSVWLPGRGKEHGRLLTATHQQV